MFKHLCWYEFSNFEGIRYFIARTIHVKNIRHYDPIENLKVIDRSF